VIDFILEISFDARDAALDEEVQSRLYLTASTGNTSNDVNGTMVVSAYFDSAAERDAAMQSLADIGGIELHAAERERVDWLDAYEQSLEPLFIGRTFVVAPDARLIPSGARPHALVIPQEQAFGTGSHETTSLCIELLETLDLDGKRGVDVGAGSGILALAMLRLGAAKAIAFDHDLDAFGALRDNRIRNGIEPARMPLVIGGIESLHGGTFDVVTMNIIPEVIVPLLPQVVARARQHLILSGILTTRRDEVASAAAALGWHVAAEREKGEWWAGLLKC
jgi:ribosomal protein L11 methyltransferase